MDINDLLGLSEPLSKLIEAIRSATGVVYEPVHMKRIALAKAEEVKLLESAKTEAAIASAQAFSKLDATTLALIPGIPEDVVSRMQQRVIHQELNRQENIDNVVAHAALALPDVVSQEKPTADWMKHLFAIVEDVSDAKLQHLWGKILAGEVASPGRFSLRSMNVLKNLTQKEALLFASACRLVLGMNEFIMQIPLEPTTLAVTGDNEAMKGFGLAFGSMMTLADAGLVYPDVVSWTLTPLPFSKYCNGRYLSFELIPQESIEDTTPVKRFRPQIPPSSLPVIRFTEAGKALGGLIADDFYPEYIDCLAERYQPWGIKISVHPPSV